MESSLDAVENAPRGYVSTYNRSKSWVDCPRRVGHERGRSFCFPNRTGDGGRNQRCDVLGAGWPGGSPSNLGGRFSTCVFLGGVESGRWLPRTPRTGRDVSRGRRVAIGDARGGGDARTTRTGLPQADLFVRGFAAACRRGGGGQQDLPGGGLALVPPTSGHSRFGGEGARLLRGPRPVAGGPPAATAPDSSELDAAALGPSFLLASEASGMPGQNVRPRGCRTGYEPNLVLYGRTRLAS